jgi:hypothetical protein
VRTLGQDIGLPVLKELKHPPNVVLELLGQRVNIVIRKERDQVGGLGRVTPHELNRVSPFEDARHFIAGHENGDLSLRTCDPLGEFPLGVGVRAIYFI